MMIGRKCAALSFGSTGIWKRMGLLANSWAGGEDCGRP